MDNRKICSECNIPSDEFNTDVFGDVICGECGVQSHCFCDDCGEYVPTSHCSVKDSVLDVDGMEIEESKVICNVCDENSDEPSTDPRGEELKRNIINIVYGIRNDVMCWKWEDRNKYTCNAFSEIVKKCDASIEELETLIKEIK